MTVLEDFKQEIVKRYDALRPALAEAAELREAAEGLGIDLDGGAAPAAPRTRGRGRRSASSTPRTTAKKSSGPRRRRSNRRDQVLKLVTERPGITVPELGKALKVDPTGLYRVVKQLQSDGAIVKQDQQLHPAG
jgi:hypothetical protein